MLLVVTIALVVVALVLLVVGFVQHSLDLIYASILCSVIAALILILVARLARRRSLPLSAAPAPAGFPQAHVERHDVVPPVARPSAPEVAEVPSPPPVAPPVEEPVVANHLSPVPAIEDDPEYEEDEEYVFPIEDYDELRVNEILPLLTQLDPAELEEVREWEMNGRRRVGIIRRIDTRLRAAGIEPPPGLDSPGPGAVLGAPPSAADLPIAGYDRLTVTEVVPLLSGLRPDQLAVVEAYEVAGANRATVLRRIQRLQHASGVQTKPAER